MSATEPTCLHCKRTADEVELYECGLGRWECDQCTDVTIAAQALVCVANHLEHHGPSTMSEIRRAVRSAGVWCPRLDPLLAELGAHTLKPEMPSQSRWRTLLYVPPHAVAGAYAVVNALADRASNVRPEQRQLMLADVAKALQPPRDC